MKLCIFVCDTLAAPMQPLYEHYGVMFSRLFEQVGVAPEHVYFDVQKQQYPQDYQGFDAVLITGSASDSFSDEPWIVRLREEVTQLLQQGVKLVGICFGHQIISLCLGVPVERSANGWGAALEVYEDKSGSEPSASMQLLASHRDQVQALPKGAELLLTNDHCPIAAYRLGSQVISIQAHPEFDRRYMAHILDKRRSDYVSEEFYQRKVASLNQEHEGVRAAARIHQFVMQGQW